MNKLLIHVPPSDTSTLANLQIGAGETVRFGRGIAEYPVEIALPNPAVPRLAGEIVATDSYWLVSNLSSDLSLLVENPEGAGEYVRVAPRRLAAPIPFEFSRVVLATQSGSTSFQVYAPCHSYADRCVGDDRPGATTVQPFSLNEQATYFLVLVALCEPRLRDLSSAGIPTTPQIVERLRQHHAHGQMGASAVNFHIDYLVDTKLRIRTSPRGERRDARRETLVAAALRFGLVQEQHLALLPVRASLRSVA